MCDEEITDDEIYYYRTNAFGDLIIFCSERCYKEDVKK